MRPNHLLPCLAIACTLSQPALSEEGEWYAGVQYTMLEAELAFAGNNVNADLDVANIIVGQRFNEFFAVEGLMGIGLNDDAIASTQFNTFDFELDYIVGLTAVAYVPFIEYGAFYGKLGPALAEYDDSANFDSDALGVYFAFGLDITYNEKIHLTFDYVQYPDGKYDDANIDIETDGYNFGANYQF